VKPVCFGLLVGLAFWGAAAYGQEGPIRLDFEAPAGCPGRDEFIAHVRARTERVHFVGGDTASVSELYVKADYEGDRAVGRLRLGKSQDAERLVTGKNCPDVISALALIAAVAIDPTAITDPVMPGQATVAPAAPASPDPASQERALEVPILVAPEKPEPAPERRSPLAWLGGMGAQGEISRGLGPRSITLAGGSIFGEAGLALGATWKPAVRLAALLAASPTVLPEQTPDSGAATFTLMAGRLSFCPLEFSPLASFRVRPCADFELGQLTGKGRPVDNGSVTSLRTGAMTRVAVGQSAQGRIRVASRLWLEMEAAAREPLLRQNFVFHTPDVAVVSVSPVELFAALGLGVHFP
jgi:hypothetical protein